MPLKPLKIGGFGHDPDAGKAVPLSLPQPDVFVAPASGGQDLVNPARLFATPEEQLAETRFLIIQTLSVMEAKFSKEDASKIEEEASAIGKAKAVAKTSAGHVKMDAANVALKSGLAGKADGLVEDAAKAVAKAAKSAKDHLTVSHKDAEEMTEGVLEKAKDAFGASKEALLSAKEHFMHSFVKEVVGEVMPFVGMAKKLKTAVEASWNLHKLNTATKGVAFQHGAAQIAEAIKGAVKARAHEQGIAFAIKTAETLLGLATLGASKLGTAIARLVYGIYECVRRYMEVDAITALIAVAKKEFERRNDPGAMWRDGPKFGKWLSVITKRAPVLAATIMTMGVAGPVEAFVEMFPDGRKTERVPENTAIQQANVKHAQGLAAKKELKQASATLLSSGGMPNIAISKGSGASQEANRSLQARLDQGKEAALVSSEQDKYLGIHKRLAIKIASSFGGSSKDYVDKIVKTSTVLATLDHEKTNKQGHGPDLPELYAPATRARGIDVGSVARKNGVLTRSDPTYVPIGAPNPDFKPGYERVDTRNVPIGSRNPNFKPGVG